MSRSKPCITCGAFPKQRGKHRCSWCLLAQEPIDDQIQAARKRAAMIPEQWRRKRVKAVLEQAPAGTSFCAGCQSFMPLASFRSGATQCRACTSATQHASMVKRTYGITADDYARMYAEQDGRCAICGNRPRSKRLVVDHRHSDGIVRGLLCGGSEQSGCNFGLGLFHDDPELVWRAFIYLTTPPAQRGGPWWERVQETTAPDPDAQAAQSAQGATGDDLGIIAQRSPSKPPSNAVATPAVGCERVHYLPVGSRSVDGVKHLYYTTDQPDAEPPF